MPKFNVKPDPFESLKGPSSGQFETVYMVTSFTQPICDPHASSEHVFVGFPRKFCEMFHRQSICTRMASFELEPFVATDPYMYRHRFKVP